MFEDLLPAWDGEEVVVRFDEPSAAWMFVCVHSTVLGPAAGGTRMKTYAEPRDALRDGLRLSFAMTSKNAMAGLPLGGGKAVLAVPEIPTGASRRALLLRYGDLVESLHGTYRTACDMNTSSADMDVVGERSSFVFAKTEAAGGWDCRPRRRSVCSTACGPRSRTRSAPTISPGGRLPSRAWAPWASPSREARGPRDPPVLTDVDDVRAKELARELDAETVGADEVYDAECDVFVPCATGGVLSAETIPGSAVAWWRAPRTTSSPSPRTRIVSPNAASCTPRLRGQRGRGDPSRITRDARRGRGRPRRTPGGIGDTLGEVFALAERRGISTAAAADAIVEERLAAGRA